MFDVSKREIFTPNSGLKSIRRKLGTNYKVTINKDAITLGLLREAQVVVFAGPRERFSAAEFEAMNEYMKEGGSIFITLGEDGESKFATNVNYFCEEYGMAFNQDAVVRTVYYKYLHPKEVHISNGVLNREINVAAGKRPKGTAGATGASAVPPAISESSPQANLSFAYPYGCSLAVQKPAFPVLSSGPLAFPLNRPVCGFWSGESMRSGAPNGGRLCLLGSSYVLHDDWIDKDENSKLVGVLMRWLTHGDVTMDPIDAEDPDVAEYHQLPDSEALAERVRCCLQVRRRPDSRQPHPCRTRRSPPRPCRTRRSPPRPPPLAHTSLVSPVPYPPSAFSRRPVPSLASPRVPPQETEEVTKDFTTLFDDSLFKFDTSLIPEAVSLYTQLDVKHEPLSLIPPQFEHPLPPLQPAVFPPSLREPPPPALDLFDLDDQFASEKVRLAHLTNKCNDEDLEYFIKEAGDMLGVNAQLRPEQRDARHVLASVFKQIAAWKKLNAEPENMAHFKKLNNMP